MTLEVTTCFIQGLGVRGAILIVIVSTALLCPLVQTEMIAHGGEHDDFVHGVAI